MLNRNSCDPNVIIWDRSSLSSKGSLNLAVDTSCVIVARNGTSVTNKIREPLDVLVDLIGVQYAVE